MKSQTEGKKDYLLNSELKTILEYIISGQTDRLQQSEWISVANKLLNKGGETLSVVQPPTDTNQVISSEIYE